MFDVVERGRARAKLLFDLCGRALKELRPRVHNVPGNHEVFGNSTKSGVPSSHPLFGKGMFADRIGPHHYPFTHKGWHFFQRYSIGITSDRGYRGFIDEEQMDWLRKDLEAAGRATPVAVNTLIPLATGFGLHVGVAPERRGGIQIVNGEAVLEMFQGHALRAVLQGQSTFANKWSTTAAGSSLQVRCAAIGGKDFALATIEGC